MSEFQKNVKCRSPNDDMLPGAVGTGGILVPVSGLAVVCGGCGGGVVAGAGVSGTGGAGVGGAAVTGTPPPPLPPPPLPPFPGNLFGSLQSTLNAQSHASILTFHRSRK